MIIHSEEKDKSIEHVKWQLSLDDFALKLDVHELNHDLNSIKIIEINPIRVGDSIQEINSFGRFNDPAYFECNHLDGEALILLILLELLSVENIIDIRRG